MKAIIYSGENALIAQCLEKDIMATNKDNDIRTLLSDLFIQIRVNEDVKLPPAPTEFHEMWKTGEELLVESKDDKNDIDLRKVA